MSKTKKILTAKEFLEQKKIYDEKRSLVYHSERFGGDIVIDDNIDVSEIAEIVQQADLNETERYIRLIYTCCPLFKAPEFRDVYTVKEPYDVVRESFKCTGMELFELGNQILQVYGILDFKTVENIKK